MDKQYISDAFVNEYCYDGADIDLESLQLESFLRDEKTSWSVALAVTGVITFLELMMMGLQLLALKGQSKLLPEKTEEIKKIVNDEIKVKLIPTKEPNAFNAGGKSLYITSGLLKMLNPKEATAVLLHEYGHYVGKHMVKRIGLTMSPEIISEIILIRYVPEVFSKFFSIILTKMFISLGYNVTFGRRHEYFSDSYAAKLGYKQELISSLKKIDVWVREQLCKKVSESECDRIIEEMHRGDAHPILNDRVKNILSSLAKTAAISPEKVISIVSKLKDYFIDKIKGKTVI
jgi:Zn-dependent protease with chaperone function